MPGGVASRGRADPARRLRVAEGGQLAQFLKLTRISTLTSQGKQGCYMELRNNIAKDVVSWQLVTQTPLRDCRVSWKT